MELAARGEPGRLAADGEDRAESELLMKRDRKRSAAAARREAAKFRVDASSRNDFEAQLSEAPKDVPRRNAPSRPVHRRTRARRSRPGGPAIGPGAPSPPPPDTG